MVTASSLGARYSETGRHRGSARRLLIRQASAWCPGRAPAPAPLQELERADAIRWVDLNADRIRPSEALALLDPVCGGRLDAGLVGELTSPGRGGADCTWKMNGISLRSSFRIRETQGENGGAISVFEPVRLLSGPGWLVSAWHEPRVYRGITASSSDSPDGAEGLYLAVASRWLRENASTARDLARIVCGELDSARPRRFGSRAPRLED